MHAASILRQRASPEDLRLYAEHEPPCVRDTLLRRELPLSTIGVGAGGLVIPDFVHREISNARTGVQHAAERARVATARPTRPRPIEPPARQPFTASYQRRRREPWPLSTAKPSKLTCKTCGLPLDPVLARLGRHIGC